MGALQSCDGGTLVLDEIDRLSGLIEGLLVFAKPKQPLLAKADPIHLARTLYTPEGQAIGNRLLKVGETVVVRRRRLWPRALDSSRPLDATLAVPEPSIRCAELAICTRPAPRYASTGTVFVKTHFVAV